MNNRFVLFMLLAGALFLGNLYYLALTREQRPQQPDKKPADQEAKQPLPKDEVEIVDLEPAPAFDPREPETENPEQWISLGAADPESGFRLLLTLSTRGGSIYRAESNESRYLDLEARQDRDGYLGELALQPSSSPKGVRVAVVGRGTAAEKAGLKVGDVITGVQGPRGERQNIETTARYREVLRSFRVNDPVKLFVRRPPAEDGAAAALPVEMTLNAQLVPIPLSIIDPQQEYNAFFPYSMLLTLQNLDEQAIPTVVADLSPLGVRATPSDRSGVLLAEVQPNSPAAFAGLRRGDLIRGIDEIDIASTADLIQTLNKLPSGTWTQVRFERDALAQRVPLHLPDEFVAGPQGPRLKMRKGHWKVHRVTEASVEFRMDLVGRGLTAIKRYTLGKSTPENVAAVYVVGLEFDFINTASQERSLVYQLDGPLGLPIEGWWYGNKIGRQWSAVGVRDFAYYVQGASPAMVSCHTIAAGEATVIQPAEPLWYAAVDAHYFASAVVPSTNATLKPQSLVPLRVGPVPENSKEKKLTNTSFRLVGAPLKLPGGQTLSDDWQPGPTTQGLRLFIGPKAPALLDQAGENLSELVYYGWFGWVARPMLAILRFFYGIVQNYGIAILLLTVLVRACMFPLSKKQALSAQKMQELQPELRRINEKYKKNYEARTKATQDLFRKHNYNPFGGCLLLFVQLPIFVGLYRGLMVNVELRQAPLIPGLSWCSNLAAPDMLFRWDGFMPEFLASKTGWLGPYFNILPIITIALFLVHQKMFMPPPADEQAALQQKMMKFMMIFFGFLFFCVPSGLCIYFIASSLWGITERKLLPKTQHAAAAAQSPASERAERKSGANGSPAAGGKKKQRGGR